MASDLENSCGSPSSTMSSTSNSTISVRPTFNFIQSSVPLSREQMQMMKKAARIVQMVQGDVVAMSEEDCMAVVGKELHTYFVTLWFEGVVFEQLRHRHCRIISPHVIISCFKDHVPIPKYSRPVFNMSMQGLTVCCSALESEKRMAIQRKVEFMMGVYSKEFHAEVTHLITTEVGSKKYKVATDKGTKVVLPEWVDAAWETLGFEHLQCADDKSFVDPYRLPIFQGLMICVSGLPGEQREEVESTVVKNGATYSANMKQGDCSHLITNTMTSQKYTTAKKWKILTVTIDWMYDSMKKGYAADEGLYDPSDMLKHSQKPKGASTPTDDKHRERVSLAPMELDCSAIGGARANANTTVCSNVSGVGGNRSLVNETVQMAGPHKKAPVANLVSRMNATTLDASKMMAPPSTVIKATKGRKMSALVPSGSAGYVDKDSTPIELTDLTITTSGSFLENCRIYASGFDAACTEKVRKMINAGGGTRLNKLDSSVTHFVVGARNESDMKKLEQLKNCHLVHCRWLVKSFNKGRVLDVEPFLLPRLEKKVPLVDESPARPAKKLRASAAVMSRPINNSQRTIDNTNDLPDDTTMGMLAEYVTDETSRATVQRMTDDTVPIDELNLSKDSSRGEDKIAETPQTPGVHIVSTAPFSTGIPKTPAVAVLSKTTGNDSLRWDTPGKYLDPNTTFHPNFELEDDDLPQANQENQDESMGTLLDKMVAIGAENSKQKLNNSNSNSTTSVANDQLVNLLMTKKKDFHPAKQSQPMSSRMSTPAASAKKRPAGIYGKKSSRNGTPKDKDLKEKSLPVVGTSVDRQNPSLEVGWADHHTTERTKIDGKLKNPDQPTPSLDMDVEIDFD